LVLVAAAIVQATVPVPPFSDSRAAILIGTGVLTAVAALVRRRYPFVLLAGAVVHGLESGDASAAYAFVRYGPTGRLRWVVLGLAAAVALQPWQFTSGTEALNNVLVVIALLVLPAVLGLWVRTRAELLTALRERAERAEAEQQLRAREAVLAERARITREMHDMVGHRVSLMVLQAGAIDMAADDPDRGGRRDR